jgi:hypothetical protein
MADHADACCPSTPNVLRFGYSPENQRILFLCYTSFIVTHIINSKDTVHHQHNFMLMVDIVCLQRIMVRLPVGVGEFCLHRNDCTGYGAQQASYSVGTSCFLSGIRAAGT